ncbi:MAG TPA: hypothetical protein VMX58_04570 [Patescibacteria group bacterium]|nr:hypothetical protein [Patescibacteria group bacterium]
MKSIHVISLGFCAVLAQAVFVREMLALFTGTELIVGALLAGWLFWVGAGGILGGRIIAARTRRTYRAFQLLAVSISLLYPATAVLIRLGRGYLSRPPGTLPPFFLALAFSLLAMAPYGFLYGTVYNVASGLAARGPSGMSGGIARVYIWEAAGSLAGALAFSFFLIVRFSQLETTFIVSIAVIAVVLLAGARGRPLRARVAIVMGLGIVFLLAASRIDRASIERVYPGYRVERFLSSRYGEIVAASREEILSFYSGGSRLFSVPEPERAEEGVHIPLLAHPSPRRVLLIGGSLGGGWEEAVKHPMVESIDCVELDGALLALALEMDSVRVSRDDGAFRLEGSRAGDAAVRFYTGDGRFFLSRRVRAYDVIVLNAPPPLNLQWNRYYTAEFFDLVKRSLRDGGIFACSHPSSENFLTRDQARVLRAIQSTMARVFGEITVLPGSTAHFIAGAPRFAAGELLDRLARRNIETRYISEDFLPFRFSEDRVAQLEAALAEAHVHGVNTDTRPVVPLYELLLEGRRLGLAGVGMFEGLLHLPFYVPPLVLVVLFAVLFSRVAAGRAARVGVMTVGMGSLIFQVVILLAFQSFTGYLYRAIVLLTALFMAGASIGAFATHRRAVVERSDLRFVHLIFAALLVSFVALLAASKGFTAARFPAEPILYLYAAACGFCTGLYYPLVVRTALGGERVTVPAVFYSWDLFGACAGGVLGGAVLLPVTGIVGTVLLIVAVHLLAAVMLVGKW